MLFSFPLIFASRTYYSPSVPLGIPMSLSALFWSSVTRRGIVSALYDPSKNLLAGRCRTEAIGRRRKKNWTAYIGGGRGWHSRSDRPVLCNGRWMCRGLRTGNAQLPSGGQINWPFADRPGSVVKIPEHGTTGAGVPAPDGRHSMQIYVHEPRILLWQDHGDVISVCKRTSCECSL